MIGQTISHYKITEKLGEGGMGVVYKAEDLRLQRPVALKFLPSNSWGNEEAKARFFREARAAAALQHPNICTVYEIDEVDGQLFIAMAYLEGRELAKEIEDGPLGVGRLLNLAIQSARGLEEAHRSGVVHRDIKPANIMVSSGGRAVLMDFGLAQLNSATSKLTREGTTVGTSAYMSPEQTTGETLDHRTDIWAFGVVLYEMATGELPFKGYYEQAVLYSILNDPPEPLTALRANAPGELERIVNKCLAKQADERYQTVSDLLAGLSELQRRVESGEGPPPEPLETQPPKPRRAFVGREEEKTELGQLLESVRQGNGSLVLIGGEPGVGKTRLCEEILADAGEQQMLVLAGHCYEGEGAQPFIPFVESLELASRIVPRAEFRAALGEAAPEVAKLMPELRRTFPDIPEAIQLPAEQQRRYLFNSFKEFVARLSKQRPIVWLLDDLHWADESSLLLLQHFAPGLENLPVLVLGTYRDVELEVGKPFEKALAQVVRQRLARRMALKRLPQASVADLLAILGGGQPLESLVKVIYEETEGNPFFVEEVFHHLSEEGKLFDQDGHWKPDLKADELEVPEGVRLVIGRRLERLSSQAPKILTAAAVIGRIFDLGTLESLEGFDPDDVLDAIDEAESAKLIVSESIGREVRYSFTHELVRHTLLLGPSLPRRQRMHLRVAYAVEKEQPENVGGIAHHLFHAGAAADTDKTVRYLSLAGERALAAAAADEARRYFDDALSLDSDDDQTRAKLLLGRGRAYRGLGLAEEAVRDLGAALPVFEELKDSRTAAAVCLELVNLLWLSLGRIENALAYANRGLDGVGLELSADRCRLLAAAASVSFLSREYSDAESQFEQAAAMATALADRSLEAEVYRCKAQHYWVYSRLRKGIDAGTRASDLLRARGELWGLADALAWTHQPLLFMGRVEESVVLLEESERVANQVGNFGSLWCARAMRMFQMGFDGDLRRLETTGRDTLEWCLRLGIYWGICQTYALLALLKLWRWHYDEALDYARQSVAAESDQAIHICSRPTLMLVQAYGGDKEALRQIDEIKLPTIGQVSDLGKITGLLFVIEALAVLGENDAAAKLYPLMSEPLNCMKIACFGALMPETGAGISAAAGREWDTAEAHLRTALRFAQEIPHKLEQPQVRYWYAKMLIDRGAAGDRDKARELLEGAIREYQIIGMPRHHEMARELQAGI